MIGGVKVTETYENGILSSVEIVAGRRILYFSTKFEPIKCFYTPPLKPGRIRRLSRECRNITRKEFNIVHKKFINRMKLKGLRDAQRRQNDY